MTSPQDELPDDRTLPQSAHEEVSTREDEINLVDCFRVLWVWRYLILTGSILPALLAGLLFLFSSDCYEMTYKYEIPSEAKKEFPLPELFLSLDRKAEVASEPERDEPDERYYKGLIDIFYSTENCHKLSAELREKGLDEFAREISTKNVRLELSRALLTMTIAGRSRKDLGLISSVVRNNFENVVPIYVVEERLIDAGAALKTKMSHIEGSRFHRTFELERKKAVLAKLKSALHTDLAETVSEIVLHFHDVNDNIEYLPLAYQAQVIQAGIISIEEGVDSDRRKYEYYKKLLALIQRMSEELMQIANSHYTIRDFRAYLVRMAGEHENTLLADFLSAYVNIIESEISTNTPITKEAVIVSVPKNTVKKVTIVFVVMLTIMIFAAFFLEGLRKGRSQALCKNIG